MESPAQRNRCSATEEAQEICACVGSHAGRMRISPLPLPVRSPTARAKPRSFPAEPRGLSPYPARGMQAVGADSSLVGNPLQHPHLVCGETSNGGDHTPALQPQDRPSSRLRLSGTNPSCGFLPEPVLHPVTDVSRNIWQSVSRCFKRSGFTVSGHQGQDA